MEVVAETRVAGGAHFISPRRSARSNLSLVAELLFRPARNSKAGVGAMRRARRHPQSPAVGFDDGSADGESHHKAVRFRGEEGLEDTFRDGRNSRRGVRWRRFDAA
jgi:hypothetical protein